MTTDAVTTDAVTTDAVTALAAPGGAAPVLWYVHHHGAGHWRRALAVARQLTRPVIFVSSLRPPWTLPPHARFVELAPDLSAGDHPHREPGAHGAFHWAPLHHPGLLSRHAALLALTMAARPVCAVVDVSVEVAVLLRLSGLPLIAVRLPGDRTDDPMTLNFQLADEVLMPVPPEWGLHRGLPRTRAVGFVGAGRSGPPSQPPAAGPVLVVVGQGGSRIDPTVCTAIATDLPDRQIRVLGLTHTGSARLPANLRFLGHVDDPGAELRAAGVVIGNCGLGTLSDVICAGRPLVALPEDRPFGEQAASAHALRQRGDAVVLGSAPAAGGWRAAVLAAQRLGPARLPAAGAAVFAGIVEDKARREQLGRALVPR